MTDYYPRDKKMKYFFAYYKWMGLHWPMKWCTEDGITVGGHPFPAIDKVEISADDAELELSELVRKYPRKVVTETTPETDTNSV